MLDQNNLLTCFWLTVGMLIGKPVVFGILELKMRVSELALLGSEILKVFWAVVSVAELILVVYSRAVLATVGGTLGNGLTTEERIRHLQRGGFSL